MSSCERNENKQLSNLLWLVEEKSEFHFQVSLKTGFGLGWFDWLMIG